MSHGITPWAISEYSRKIPNRSPEPNTIWKNDLHLTCNKHGKPQVSNHQKRQIRKLLADIWLVVFFKPENTDRIHLIVSFQFTGNRRLRYYLKHFWECKWHFASWSKWFIRNTYLLATVFSLSSVLLRLFMMRLSDKFFGPIQISKKRWDKIGLLWGIMPRDVISSYYFEYVSPSIVNRIYTRLARITNKCESHV